MCVFDENMKRSLSSVLVTLLLLAGCATGWKAIYTADSARELIDRVRKHVPTVVLANVANPLSLAGHYTTGSGLSGSELYLFPDGTYMHTEWADILPETLSDRGTWSCSEGLLRLFSDGTLSKVHPRDKVYVGLHYNGTHPLDSISGLEVCRYDLLMGTNWDFTWYIESIQDDIEEGWKNQDIFEDSLLSLCLKKAEDVRIEDIAEKKRALSVKLWTPFLEN